MLESLVRYAQRHGIGSDPAFAERWAKWAISLDASGKYRGVIPLGDPTEKGWKGRSFKVAPHTPPAELQSGGKSHFLIEGAMTVLLMPDREGESVQPKYRNKHRCFADLIADAVTNGVSSLAPVATFLKDQESIVKAGRDLLAQKKAKRTDTVTFFVECGFPVEETDWHSFWRKQRQAARGSPSVIRTTMPCLATGTLAVPMETHGKIKGVWGTTTMGASLIATDKDAFQSYGLAQSHNAPVSEAAESQYREALQHLVNRAVPLAGAQFIYWTRETAVVDPVAIVREGEDADLGFVGDDEGLRTGSLLQALRAVKDGRYVPTGAEGNTFYGCTLSGNGGRIVVRDWWESSVPAVLSRVAQWADDLSTISPNGGFRLPKLGELLYSLVRRDLKELPADLSVRLMHCALRGFPAPNAILTRCLDRHIADIRGGILRAARIGLIRLCLNRSKKEGEPTMASELNTAERDQAYRCGRLLAVLEQIQRSALPHLESGIIERFYGAVSATPALIMPRLIRLSKHHLAALSGGLAHYFQKQIEDILDKAHMGTAFPSRLTVVEQGRFALGYYHQRTRRANTGQESESATKEGDTANV